MDEAINVCKDSIAEKGKKILEMRSQEESIDLLEEVLYVMNIITIIYTKKCVSGFWYCFVKLVG